MLPLLLLISSIGQVEDGTLLFVANGSAIVQNHTDSTLTHVGVVANINGEPYFYDAVLPKVRKVALRDYLKELEDLNKKKRKIPLLAWIAKPKESLTREQRENLRKYLDSQVDRPYSIESYLAKQSTDGIHCCELTGTACQAAGIKYTINPCADAPKDVWRKIKNYYEKPIEIDID